MIWRDNSNIDFKWNILKMMTLTLIAIISFIVSKSLLFLHFLQNRKNFNESHNTAHKHFRCASTFLFLIFWILLHCWYEHFFAFAFSLWIIDFSLMWPFCTHIFIHEFIIFICVRYIYYIHLFFYFWSLYLRFVSSFLLFPSLFFFLFPFIYYHYPNQSSIFPLISSIIHTTFNSFCILLMSSLCRWQHR